MANAQRGPLRHPTGEGLATRIAFTVIVLFVLAQVGWWLMFQTQLLDRAASEREAAWARDLATVGELLETDPGRSDALLARYPHLRQAAGAPGEPPIHRLAFQWRGRCGSASGRFGTSD